MFLEAIYYHYWLLIIYADISFWKLKRIKDEVTNRMGYNRLNSGPILIIENGVLKEVDFWKCIHEISWKYI